MPYDIFHDKIKTFQKTTLFGKRRLTKGIYGDIHRVLLTDYCIKRFLPYLFLSEDIAHKALPRPSQSYSNTRREKQMATGSHRCRSQCRGGTALCACLNRETNISSEPLFLLMCWASWPLDKSNGDFIIALIQLMTHALKVVPPESK